MSDAVSSYPRHTVNACEAPPVAKPLRLEQVGLSGMMPVYVVDGGLVNGGGSFCWLCLFSEKRCYRCNFLDTVSKQLDTALGMG